MDAMDILKEIKEVDPDNIGFWYIYGVVVTMILVILVTTISILVKGFLTSFLTDIKSTHKQFAESIAKLTAMVGLHENEIEHLKEDSKRHDDDIKELVRRRRQ
jgi:Tfp pilus assembly protein PilO